MKNAEDHARRIWNAAVAAVKPGFLLPGYLKVAADTIQIADREYSFEDFSGVLVLGFGKAAAEMAAVVEGILKPIIASGKTLRGYVNAPLKEDGSIQRLEHIEVHGARPAGSNRPTEAAARGADTMLELAAGARADELVLVLISGGGSALTPSPVSGVSLEEKLELTRFLNEEVGAPIEALNCVRRALSRFKGGGLARACRGKAVHGLILSDVMGDDLSVISSGPLEKFEDEREKALAIVTHYDPERTFCPQSVYEYLESNLEVGAGSVSVPVFRTIVGNNESAVAAAAAQAASIGLAVSSGVNWPEAPAGIADRLTRFLIGSESAPAALVGGGEPLVYLPENPGKGGRNQHLILEVIARVSAYDLTSDFCILSAGTDGEDGPTDAAGGFVTPSVLQSIREKSLDLEQAIVRANGYEFLAEAGGLFKSGLTGTNVCDIWIAVKF